ncbi:DNA topoisomerase III [Bifidobacterium aemilianum]|uniref:DNA topoisomerase n=1 Tax=Bifidobacterium aemilianum TaxID=2493120 RepID=A0A366KB20_9BIFI|nr:type IA DNA topoisomerase [Bifidobacterium aemilianum]RBP97861.1 DNA topoisomerase III [Bifidobacterium aemilianum]
MRLVIAEKHSVATAIAKALDPNPREQDGCLRAGDTLISWAQGHLVDLATPDRYKDQPWSDKKWSMDQLPIIPQRWQWEISGDKGADQRYSDLVALMRRHDVTDLVNACDPDREGEAIFARIITHAGIHKPTLRLWVASLDEEAIREAWTRMKPLTEYQGLADSADARAKADWLIGMNASRAHTIAYRRRISIGRVQTPTLALVVERDRQIRNHVSTPYYTVVAHMGQWTLTSEHLPTPDQAQRILDQVRASGMVIDKVDRTQVSTKPPTLYDLTGLQKAMNRPPYGLSAAQTLAAMQKLYEAKLVTYPRTDSTYITHNDLGAVKALVADMRLVDGILPGTPTVDSIERLVNDAKVAGHTAILPTRLLNARILADLPQEQILVAKAVVLRLWEAIGAPYIHDSVKVTAHINGVDSPKFTASTDTPVSLGWKSINPTAAAQTDDNDEQDGKQTATGRIPDDLRSGLTLLTIHGDKGAEIRQGKTDPPKRFTESTLLAAMEHASRFVDDRNLKQALDDDSSHSGGIGTPATRADIIETLVKGGYLLRTGRQIKSTQDGEILVEVAVPALKEVVLTAKWEQQLSDIEHNKVSETAFLAGIEDMCRRLPDQVNSSFRPEYLNRERTRESFGPCPRCGAPVVKTGSLWQCSTNKSQRQQDGSWKQTEGCGYKIFGTLSGKTLTDSVIRQVLQGKTVKLSGFHSKEKNKSFTANLVSDPQRGIAFKFRK